MKPLLRTVLVAAGALAILTACSSSSKQPTRTEEESAGDVGSAEPGAGESAGTPSNVEEAEQAGKAETAPPAAFSKAEMNKEAVLNQMHHINQKEIEVGNLGIEKAQSPEVKSAAQRIVADHQQLETQVQSVAQQENIKLEPFQPSTDEKATMNRLKGLSGSDFDLAFTLTMENGHRVAERELKADRAEVKDPEVRALIDRALPKIKQHLKMMAQLDTKLTQQAAQASVDSAMSY